MKYLYSSFKPLLIVLFSTLTIVANAQTIGTYTFNSTLSPSGVASNSSLSNITTGAGITSNLTTTPGSIFLNSTAAWPASLTNAIAGTSYIEFTITPTVGYEVNLKQFRITALRGAAGPKYVNIVYNTGSGFLPGNASLTDTITATSLTKDVDITDFTFSSAVVFRVYGYIGTAATPKTLTIDQLEINGYVAIASPTIQSSLSLTSKSINSITLSFTGGNGSNRIVLAQEGTSLSTNPIDLTSYTASSAFGTSPPVNSSAAFAVYIGTGNSVTVTNLNAGTYYSFGVYEFNKSAGANTENYLFPGNFLNEQTAKGVYTWAAGSSGLWSDPTSWAPNRLTPSLDGSDSLIFNSGGTINATDVPDGEAFGGLSIINNTHVVLSSSAPATAYLIDFAGNELFVESGSELDLNSAQDLTFYLDVNALAWIDGTISLNQLNNTIIGTGDLAVNGTISFVQTDGLQGTSGSYAVDSGLNSLTLGTSSTVNYAGSAQTITTSIPYANLTLSGSGTKTPDGNLAVNNLTLAGSSVLTLGSYDLSVAGNWTSYGAAAFTETGKTVTFNGTGSQTLNTTGGEIFEGLTLANSSLTLSSALRINGLLTLNSGTLNSGGNLTLNLATAKIPGTGSGSISGNMNVIQSMTQNKTHYIGSPLAGVTAADIADEYTVVSGIKSRLLDIDCSNNKFFGIYDMSTAIAQGDAYSMFIPTGTGTLTFTGTYNHAGTGYSSSCNFNSAVHYFFAGNPYPSNLYLNGVSASGTTGAYYVLNNSGTYDTYSSVTSSGTGSISSGYVAPMQGFQVQTNGLGGTASVTFPSSARDVAQPTSFVRLASANTLIRLKVSNSTYTDEALVIFTDDATNGFELGYDATKMMNTGSAPNLYTIAENNNLVINSLAQPEGAVEIPLNLTSETTGNYTLSFANKASFDAGTAVSLIFPDGSTHDLVASPTVTVSTNPVKPYILKVGTTNLTTATSNATSTDALKAWMNDETLNVTLTGKTIQTVEVYDVVGNKIMSSAANSDTFSNFLSVKGGIYIVKVISGNDVFSTKVLVK